jgi:lysylphosphatidylglycerol synthetase-like protein (DUF2156 family)
MPADNATRPGAENATDEYGRIFVLLLGVFFFTMFTTDTRWLRILVALAVVAVFLGTLRATGVTERRMRQAIWISMALGIAALVAGFSDTRQARSAVSFAAAVGLGVCVLLLVRRIFETERIRLREVVAGLTAYTLIALGFSFLYAGAAYVTDSDFFNNGIAGDGSDFAYFSVVTVTTLGYGDLSPATDVGRSLVILETLLGQIFLVVLVAFLVGMLGKARPLVDPDRSQTDRSD